VKRCASLAGQAAALANARGGTLPIWPSALQVANEFEAIDVQHRHRRQRLAMPR
jgi:hypothetical protein